MKKLAFGFILYSIVMVSSCSANPTEKELPQPTDTSTVAKVAVWVTNGQQTKLLQQENALNLVKTNPASPLI